MRSRLLLTEIVMAAFLAQTGRAQAPSGGQASPRFVTDREVPARLAFENNLPVWSGRSMLGVELNNRSQVLIFSTDREGRREEIWFSIPEASLIQVYSALAGTQDGAIAISGTAYGADRAATFLAWIPPDRKQQVVTRVWPYCPDAIAVAPDGGIWAVGRLKDEADDRIEIPNIMRHYDHSGHLLGSWRVTAKGLKRIAMFPTMGSHLLALRDRIGWLTNAGEYVEYSHLGAEMARFDALPGAENEQPHITGVALSPEGALYIGVTSETPRPGVSRVLMLDRKARTWVPVIAELKEWSSLAGLDGESLVVLTAVGELGRVRRYKPDATALGQ